MHDDASQNEIAEAVVRAFESACDGSQSPSVDDYVSKLQSLDEPLRTRTLHRIVGLELQSRRRRGDSVAVQAFVERFPQLDAERLNELVESPSRREPRKPFLPDRYDVQEMVGRGGLGVIWRVKDKNLDRPLAAKVLRDEYQSKASANRSLEEEAVLTGSLQHPGVPPVVEQGKLLTGASFFTMKLIDGKTLAELNRQRDDSARLVPLLEILRQVARAVAFAHSQNVVHCDLKPHNVMVGRFGEVQVMDWGLAIRHSPESDGPGMSDDEKGQPSWPTGLERPSTGRLMGSPSYMAPEQAARRDGEIGPWTDVYALAAILYDLLCGQPPALGDTPEETIRIVCEEEPTPIRELRPNTPRDLATICEKGLARKPGDRYASAIAFDEDLERFLAGLPILARPGSTFERSWKWAKRRPAAATLAVLGPIVLIALSALAIGGSFYQQLQSAHRETIVQSQEAQRAKARAETLFQQAEKARATAEAAELVSERLLYAADIDLAQRAWKTFDVGQARTLLDRHAPEGKAEQTEHDVRGFEWQYLNNLCNTAKLEIECSDVICVRFSPNGKHIIAGRSGAPTSVYDRLTGKKLGEIDIDDALEIATHAKHHRLLIRSPTTIAVVDSDQFDTLFRITLSKPNSDPNSKMAVAPNGLRMAFLDGATLRTFDLVAGQELDAFPVSPTSRGVATSEKEIYVAARDGSLATFSWKGVPIGDVKRVCQSINSSMAYSANGTRAAFYADPTHVQLVDLQTGNIVAKRPSRTFLRRPVLPLAIRNAGDRFAFADGTAIQVCHEAGEDLTLILRGHRRDVTSIDLSQPTGRELVASGEDGVIRVWDVQDSERKSKLLSYEQRYFPHDFDDTGDQILLNRRDGKVDVWSLEADKAILSIPESTSKQGRVVTARFHRDGKHCVLGTRLGHTLVIDRNTGKPTTSLSVLSGPIIGIETESRGYVAYADNAGAVALQQLNDAEPHSVWYIARQSAFAFSPDGKKIAYQTGSVIKIRNIASGNILRTLPTKLKLLRALVFSGDGRRLFAGGYSLEVWNAETGDRLFHTPRQERHENRFVRFHLDDSNKRLFAALNNGECRIFDAESGRRLITLSGHATSVMRCMHLGDSGELTTCSDGGYLRIWDGRPPATD